MHTSRQVVDDEDSNDRRESAKQLAAWAHKPPKRERSKTISDSAFEKATLQMHSMAKSTDWSAATPRHILALYAWLHEKVYGVAPGELTSRERLIATGAASRMLDRDFDGDQGAMVAYVLWTWKRERATEKWRRENGRVEGRRIGWRLQFNGSLLTDYRIELARRARG
jgi:hypothetical protein